MRIFDSHAHLIADDVARYPRNPSPPPVGSPPIRPGTIGRPGGKAGPNPVHEVPDLSRMFVWMREQGVEGLAAVQKRMIYRFDNSYVLDAADSYKDFVTAVVVLDAEAQDTPTQLRQLVVERHVSGMRLFGGVGELGATPWLNSPQALRCWAVADDLGLTMDVEVLSRDGGVGSVPVFTELARRFPNVRIVLDHLMDPHVTNAPDCGLDARFADLVPLSNVYFKFTTINLDVCRELDVSASALLRRVVDLYGANRVMWGSDIGTSSGTYAEMVRRALDAAQVLTGQERSAVFRETGARVFKARTPR